MTRPRIRDARDLTPSEARVYSLIVEEGLCSREIAARCNMTYKSVKVMTCLIMAKIGVHTRLKLAVQHWKAMTSDTQQEALK